VTGARIIWPAYPYSAGFCITDDTDTATYEQVRAVYDFLIEQKFPTTKTVWPFMPEEKCGIPAVPDSALRGITLEDGRYLAYCKQLHENGYEICLHGASAGNNPRKNTQNAFEYFERAIGHSDTYICHSKNAENIYWEHNVSKLFPFNILLRLYSRHTCSGETEGSPYYWGDICRSRIRWIRLFRTRCINTLKRNPSMPYYDPAKPLVNGWFSATKRRIADCATEKARRMLKQQNGCTVLYQYLHRYADPATCELNTGFTKAVKQLAGDPGIHVATVAQHMRRLQMLQRLFVFYRGTSFWLLNTNESPIENLQIRLSSSSPVAPNGEGIRQEGSLLIIDRVAQNRLLRFSLSKPVSFSGPQARFVKRFGSLSYRFGPAVIDLHIHEKEKPGDSAGAESYSCTVTAPRSDTACLFQLPRFEEYGLLADQLFIIIREVLFKGRSLTSSRYLDARKEIKLENHDNW
jgi:hypothetical protein